MGTSSRRRAALRALLRALLVAACAIPGATSGESAESARLAAAAAPLLPDSPAGSAPPAPGLHVVALSAEGGSLAALAYINSTGSPRTLSVPMDGDVLGGLRARLCDARSPASRGARDDEGATTRQLLRRARELRLPIARIDAAMEQDSPATALRALLRRLPAAPPAPGVSGKAPVGMGSPLAENSCSRMAFFHTHGARVLAASELTTADGSPRVIFAFEGGRWLWPAVRVGHVWSVGAASLETLSVRPAVFRVGEFLTREEAAHIRRVTQPLLRRSPVTGSGESVGEEHSHKSQARTSSNAFLGRGADETVRTLEARAHWLTRTWHDEGEPIQVVHYGPGQYYEAHTDYFEAEQFEHRDPAMMSNLDLRTRDRMATLFWCVGQA